MNNNLKPVCELSTHMPHKGIDFNYLQGCLHVQSGNCERKRFFKCSFYHTINYVHYITECRRSVIDILNSSLQISATVSPNIILRILLFIFKSKIGGNRLFLLRNWKSYCISCSALTWLRTSETEKERSVDINWDTRTRIHICYMYVDKDIRQKLYKNT